MGRAEVRSEPGRGSEFTVQMPIVVADRVVTVA
jgi:signal transduction histidine kinase